MYLLANWGSHLLRKHFPSSQRHIHSNSFHWVTIAILCTGKNREVNSLQIIFPTTVCLSGLPLGKNIPHSIEWHKFLLDFVKIKAHGNPRRAPERTWGGVGERKGGPCRENGDQDWDKPDSTRKRNGLLIKITPPKILKSHPLKYFEI